MTGSRKTTLEEIEEQMRFLTNLLEFIKSAEGFVDEFPKSQLIELCGGLSPAKKLSKKLVASNFYDSVKNLHRDLGSELG